MYERKSLNIPNTLIRHEIIKNPNSKPISKDKPQILKKIFDGFMI